MKGLIFDIQRCSLHDGPGIRTTVFMKGCPLTCAFCHNPESISPLPELSFNAMRCSLCKRCVDICKNRAHLVSGNIHELKRDLCKLCAGCVSECPNEALKIIGEMKSVDNIISDIESDREYYQRSGGGATLSGGEPLMQFDLSLEVLKRLKKKKIHTAIETCGAVSKDRFEKILRYVDVFLFDYKETSPERHKNICGVSNELILSNLDLIYNRGAKIILRCPLVPGLNDSQEHLRGIASISKKYPKLAGIEIMAYHNMGVRKSENIGRNIKVNMKTVDEKIKKFWLDTLKGYGCACAVIG